MTSGPSFDSLQPGAILPPLRVVPTAVQLFRFSAVTWNAHRIHYDPVYAREEGFAGVAVHAQLHGAFLARLVTDWMGPRGRLLRFTWQNRGPSVAGEELVCRGTIRAVSVDGERGLVELELEERTADGRLCAPGSAIVALPLGDGENARGGGAQQ